MQPQTPILIAHRGGSLEAPENTMASFRHAIEIGARYVELDVQMTRDGVPVVLHDPTLDRTTTGKGPVRDVTLADLQSVDAGSHFAPRFAGEHVPTLRDVLELCVEAGVGIVTEIKDVRLYIGMEEKVAALLGEMWTRGAENLWCISFDHAAIRKMRTLDGALPLGYLYPPGQEEFVVPDDTVQAYCPHYQSPLARPDQVQRAHELGKFVFVYTVNTAEDMLAVAEAGVDGMVSDRPTLLLSTFNR
ncbi:MAG TPA: glycerophosphodiester phosphodiesterase family protein [Chloroflexia bacterium]|nr:glycerophosphodiester phosphodiesterase family protein [Chloroflexia bacterium]